MNIPYYMNNQTDLPTIPLPNPGEGGPVDSDNHTPAIPLPNPGEGGPVDSGDGFPVIPLPNPGEGGPVDSGDGFPVIPLPNPGEGGPVDSGDGFPVIPLPNPGEGGPVYPGNGGNIPVVPLPNPGEGGPVVTGPTSTIITVFPRPIIPCFFCNSNQFGNVRFLNAAVGYNPFVISVNGQTIVRTLDYAQVSQYGRISAGYQTVTVSGMNGYIYIQKQIRVRTGSTTTVAIVNTGSGLDLMEISDVPCGTPLNTACFRAANLSYNGGTMNVVLNNGFVTFNNIRYGEVTPFSRIPAGRYDIYVERAGLQPQPRFGGGQILVSSLVNVQPNTIYTLYIFNWNTSPDAIRTMVVEDRQ